VEEEDMSKAKRKASRKPKPKHLVAVTALGLVAAAVVVRPAFAESGFRVCGVSYGATVRAGGSTGPQDNYIGLFLGKVPKGDKQACQAVLDAAHAANPKDLSSDQSIPWVKGDDFTPDEQLECENEELDPFNDPDPCPGMAESSSSDVKLSTFFVHTVS
jgi:hypothetical protein